MAVPVFIDGAAGTTGLEIRERLGGRTDITFTTLNDEQRKDVRLRRDALNDADIAILCLPDDAAREAVALIDSPRTRIIDASSAHRIADGWTYGFPELGFDVLNAARVSNPGCYPTGFLALMTPLVRAGLVPRDWPVSVHGLSGYSGGGKAMIADFESGRGSAGRAYALGLAHKHLPEMQRHAGLARAPIFLPVVANTYRGMIVEIALHTTALPGRPSVNQLREVLTAAYSGNVVGVSDEQPAHVDIETDAGTDRMTLYVSGNDDTGQARLIATLDNLGKGAAGAAVQNLNLMIGAEPASGLIL